MGHTKNSPTFSKRNATTYAAVDETFGIEAVVGDEKQEKFFPRVKFKKWDNEVNFSVGVIADEAKASAQVLDAKDAVVWSQGSIDTKFYNLEDGFEFEVILKEKPATNVLTMSIETKGLDFFYQPFLTEQERLSMEIVRPADVEGSYAVYHNRKMNNKYQTGKAFHIYRPQIIDANGKWAWGLLHVDVEAKTLSITIPQSILDKGTYPLVVDPTFGYETAGGTKATEYDEGTGVTWGSIFTASEAGTLTKLTICANGKKDGQASGRGTVFLHSDLSNLCYSDLITAGAAGKQWTDFALSGSITATTYVLAFWSKPVDSSNMSGNPYYDEGDANQGHTTGGVSYNSIGSPTHSTRKYSIYATYTASASGPASLKTVNGLAVASVKTLRSGVAIASVKTWNGVA